MQLLLLLPSQFPSERAVTVRNLIENIECCCCKMDITTEVMLTSTTVILLTSKTLKRAAVVSEHVAERVSLKNTRLHNCH